MKTEHSDFLLRWKPFLKKVVTKLEPKYEFISLLATDCNGLRYQVTRQDKGIEESMWTQRGMVCRCQTEGKVREFSFNYLPEDLDEAVSYIETGLAEAALQTADIIQYPRLPDDRENVAFNGNYETAPTDADSILPRLTDLLEKIESRSSCIVNCRTLYEGVRESRLFLSPQRDLFQSYHWSQAYLFAVARKENSGNRMFFKSFSGMKGAELIEEMESEIDKVVQTVVSLLDAESLVPGEYEVIFDPETSGMIAHEAFGHGVEMDMFVKNRAKAAEMIDQKVGSEKVSLLDGALSADQVASYLFDDEGIRGKSTLILDQGVLKTGISDQLSAFQLGTEPTGNGRRESYARKAYARMTNTFFAGGQNSLETMIASIKNGYLIERPVSGMEDPKNWGIQVVALIGREIREGKITGKIVSPVVLTGALTDVLEQVSAVSSDVEMSGSGYCGKGYKEYVKVSTGGPYMKTKMRIG